MIKQINKLISSFLAVAIFLSIVAFSSSANIKAVSNSQYTPIAVDTTYEVKESSLLWTFEKDTNSPYWRIKNNESGLYLTRSAESVEGIGTVLEMDKNTTSYQLWIVFIMSNAIFIWGTDVNGSEALTVVNGKITWQQAVWAGITMNQRFNTFGQTIISDGLIIKIEAAGSGENIATGKNIYTKKPIYTPVVTDGINIANESSILWTFEKDTSTLFWRIKNNDSGLYLTRSAETVEGVGTVLEMDKNTLSNQLWNVFLMTNAIFIWGTDINGSEALTAVNGKVTWQQAVWDGITMNQRYNTFSQTISDGLTMKIETIGSAEDIATGKNVYTKTIKAIIKASNEFVNNQKWRFEKITVDNIDYYRIKNSEANNKNKYLTVFDNKVILVELDETKDTQLWTFEKNEDMKKWIGNSLRIKNKSTGNKLLTIRGNIDGSSANMLEVLHTDEDAVFCFNESWNYNDTDLFEIRKYSSSMSLQGDDVDDLEPMAGTIEYAVFKIADEKSRNQKWIFEKSGVEDYYKIKNSKNNLYLTVNKNKVSLRSLDNADVDSQMWAVQKNKEMQQWDIFAVNIMNKSSSNIDKDFLLTGTNIVDGKVTISTKPATSREALFYLDGKSDFSDGGMFTMSFYNSTVALSTQLEDAPIEEGLEVYYVSNTGNDDNNGLSETKPFKTLSKLLNINLKANNTVKIKRGSVFNEKLELINLNGLPEKHIKFTSYGEGTNPIILQQEPFNPLSINNCEYILFDKIDFISKSMESAVKIENSCGIIFKDCNLSAPNNAQGCLIANNLRRISNDRLGKNIAIVKCNLIGGIIGINTSDSNQVYISKTNITKSSGNGVSFNNVKNSILYNSAIKDIGMDNNIQTNGVSIKNSNNLIVDTVNINNIISATNENGNGVFIKGSTTSSSTVSLYNSVIKLVDGAGIYFGDNGSKTIKSNVVLDQMIIDEYGRKKGNTGLGIYFENGKDQEHTVCKISNSVIIAKNGMLPYLGYPINNIKNLVLQNVNYSYEEEKTPSYEEPDPVVPPISDVVIPIVPPAENPIQNPEKIPESKPIKKISILFRVLDVKNKPVSKKTLLLEKSKVEVITNKSGYVLFEDIEIGDEVITIKDKKKIIARFPIQILVGNKISFNGNKIFIRESDDKISVDLVLSGNIIKITNCTSGINILKVKNQWITILMIFGAVAIFASIIITRLFILKKKKLLKDTE